MLGKIEASAAYATASVYAAAGATAGTASLMIDDGVNLDRVLIWATAGACLAALFTIGDALQSEERNNWFKVLFFASQSAAAGFAVAMAGGSFVIEWLGVSAGVANLSINASILLSAFIGGRFLDFIWKRTNQKSARSPK